jgi:hypothetical protein
MPADAYNVARRHARDAAVIFRDVPAKPFRVEYTYSGRISDIALMKMIEPQVGKLMQLQSRRSLVIDPNGIEWEAFDVGANVVSGKLVLHAAVSESEVELGGGRDRPARRSHCPSSRARVRPPSRGAHAGGRGRGRC